MDCSDHDRLAFGCPYCEGIITQVTFGGERLGVTYTTLDAPEMVMNEVDGMIVYCGNCGKKLTLQTKEVWRVNKMLEINKCSG